MGERRRGRLVRWVLVIWAILSHLDTLLGWIARLGAGWKAFILLIVAMTGAILAYFQRLPWVAVFLSSLYGLVGILFLYGGLLWIALQRRGAAPVLAETQPVAPAETLEQLTILYRVAANPAYEAGDRILGQLCDVLRIPYVPNVEHRPTSEHHLAGLVNNCIREDGRRQQTPFTNAMQRIPGSGFEDNNRVQAMFGDWYRAYLRVRYWARTLAEVANTNLTGIQGYGRWRDHDREFFRRLRELAAHDRFGVLSQHVQGAGWGDDAPLPD